MNSNTDYTLLSLLPTQLYNKLLAIAKKQEPCYTV